VEKIKQRKVYLYPSRSQNDFLDLNRQALRKLDYTIENIDKAFVRDLLSMRRESIVVLNWVEDRVYGRTYRTVFQYFFKMVALIIFSRAFAKKVIWVRHNYKPHNGTKYNLRYKFLCGLFKLSGIKATPLENYYSEPSLVHPLYKTDSILKNDIAESQKNGEQRDNFVVFFGAVKRYKNLHVVLDTWPVDVPLKIAGKCSDTEYEEFINLKIKARGLAVEWDNRFLSNAELNSTLANSKFVLLPHADSTMISSGSFYHAIGEGCNIITTESQFGSFKSKNHNFVSIYDPTLISSNHLTEICSRRHEVMTGALESYGEQKVIEAWRKILPTQLNS
jgi:beta-1,4-mannosyltransferase